MEPAPLSPQEIEELETLRARIESSLQEFDLEARVMFYPRAKIRKYPRARATVKGFLTEIYSADYPSERGVLERLAEVLRLLPDGSPPARERITAGDPPVPTDVYSKTSVEALVAGNHDLPETAPRLARTALYAYRLSEGRLHAPTVPEAYEHNGLWLVEKEGVVELSRGEGGELKLNLPGAETPRGHREALQFLGLRREGRWIPLTADYRPTIWPRVPAP